MMIRNLMFLALIVLLFVASGVAEAGLFGGGCACGGSSPVLHSAPVVHASPAVHSGTCCIQAASCCCGIGGGLGGGVAHLGSLYGMNAAYASHMSQGARGGFLSGYEGLPNMDGGGVHYRYPYHSYRRPWAHPGPPSTNISIVW